MQENKNFSPRASRRISLVLLAFVASFSGASSAFSQQVVYYSPVVAQPAPYAGRYMPSGTYSNVTAYSPPVAAAVPASSVAVTNYYAPAPTAYYAPAATTAYYAPTTTYYAPRSAYYAPTSAYYAPTSAYYAPATYAVPYYRRGLFGRYRPVGAAVYPAY
jgi:DNA-directed RNA polymerase II subunit RPB1